MSLPKLVEARFAFDKLRQRKLAAGEFGFVAQAFQFGLDFFAVVALNLNDAIFDCPTCAAFLFQLLAQCSQIFGRKLQIANDGDGFAAAPFAVTEDAGGLLLGRQAFGFGTAARVTATALAPFFVSGIG